MRPARLALRFVLVLGLVLALALPASLLFAQPPAKAKAAKTPSADPAASLLPPAEPPSPQALAKLASSSNAFGLDLYQRLRSKPGNLLFSPASITTALTMAWGGAKGETASQMARVLHLSGTPEEVLPVSGALLRKIQDPSSPITFRVANQIFAEKTYKLQTAFAVNLRASFGAPLEAVDFKNAPERSRMRINAWVEEKTQRRIRDLVPPGGFSKDSRLALVNAIYFLGDWQIPFEQDETHPQAFHLSAEKEIKVPTLHRTGGFAIGQADGVTALEIPYRGAALSMVLLVPGEVEGLPAFEARLDEERLRRLLGTLKMEYVSAYLPKLDLRPVESLSLGKDLEEMGMTLAFDRNRADFRGIADPPNPQDRAALAKVYHKGFLRLDEKGTEAAAATMVGGVMGGAAGGGGPRPILFQADRPFLFLVRDRASGLILFFGRVSDPSAS